MNKNLKEVLVRREYHGQVWFESVPYDKPWPDESLPIKWTEERLKWWAEGQAAGIQYYAQGKPVYCPPRNWE